MDSNTVSSFRPRNSQRFLTSFSQSQQNPNGNGNTNRIDGELDEDEVFWTGNFSQTDHKSDTSSSSSSSSIKSDQNNHFKPSSSGFQRVDSSGILAALPGNNSNNQRKPLTENRLLYRKISFPSSSSSTTISPVSSTSSSRMIPSIPKPQQISDNQYLSASTTGNNNNNNYRHSAPVNVPVRPVTRVKKERELVISEVSDDDDYTDEMLPPHEIVAKGSSQSDMTFSVLEGIGRTLKGRDLRQVRNAVWRQTGLKDEYVKLYGVVSKPQDIFFRAIALVAS